MDELRVRLLGGLVVEGLSATDVGSRKARTLLAALAVPPRLPVSSDALADALWGDDLPAKPADQVSVLVSRLRGVLRPDRLVRVDAGYQLRADWVDVEELDRRVTEAQTHLAGGDVLAARLVATMALDLTRGPLLPEEDGEWADRPRASASRLVAAAGLLAAQAALASGDPLGAAAAAAIGLDHDPYDEAALRLLMQAHAEAGRPASALAAYAEMRERLAEDLGVSPAAETEALHARLLGTEPAAAPAAVDGWDPLVQRARVELASNDLASARRDADEAVRRGGGPGALEMAGWMAYYTRDFPAALRWAEEAAARTAEDERRESCLTLAGRVRHSMGDLPGAEVALEEAVNSQVPGVRAMGEVWLSSLRVHQGRAAEAGALATSGAVDAAAVRHPFLMVHSMFTRVYACAEQGQVVDALALIEDWSGMLADLGQVGDRYRSAAMNFQAWVLGAIGRRDEADACSRRAIELTGTHLEALAHARLDLARSAVDAGDPASASDWLDQVDVPPDESGAMAWRQRQRRSVLRAQVALAEGDPTVACTTLPAVVEDAAARGARRAELLARAVLLEGEARGGAADPGAVDTLLEDLRPLAGLERWRTAARLASATGRTDLWSVADVAASALAAGCGPAEPEVAAWLESELSRLGRP